MMKSSWGLKLLDRSAVARRQSLSLSYLSVPAKRSRPDIRLRHSNGKLYYDTSTTKREFVSSTISLPSMMTQLKELRSLSGAPIVDCKKALTEMEGDMEKSLDWLRQHGTAKASKKLSDREAEEGLVACAVSEDGKSASIVKISSETDFAGKSDTFVKLACHVASAALNSTGSSSGVLEPQSSVLSLEYDSKSVQNALDEAIVAIRENLGVSAAIKLTTQDDGLLVAYVHGKVDPSSNAGLAAAVVEISGNGVTTNPEAANEVGRKLAMHIVAAKPTYLDASGIPEDIVEKEKEILKSQIADSKKPQEVIEKIINGRMRKFYAEVCLTEQEHMVEEGNQKVSKVLRAQGLTVNSFELFSI